MVGVQLCDLEIPTRHGNIYIFILVTVRYWVNWILEFESSCRKLNIQEVLVVPIDLQNYANNYTCWIKTGLTGCMIPMYLGPQAWVEPSFDSHNVLLLQMEQMVLCGILHCLQVVMRILENSIHQLIFSLARHGLRNIASINYCR